MFLMLLDFQSSLAASLSRSFSVSPFPSPLKIKPRGGGRQAITILSLWFNFFHSSFSQFVFVLPSFFLLLLLLHLFILPCRSGRACTQYSSFSLPISFSKQISNYLITNYVKEIGSLGIRVRRVQLPVLTDRLDRQYLNCVVCCLIILYGISTYFIAGDVFEIAITSYLRLD